MGKKPLERLYHKFTLKIDLVSSLGGLFESFHFRDSTIGVGICQTGWLIKSIEGLLDCFCVRLGCQNVFVQFAQDFLVPPGKGFNFVTGLVQVPAGHLRMVYNKAGYYPACNKNLTDIHRLSGKLKPFKSGNSQYLSDLDGFGAHCAYVLAEHLRLDFNGTAY